MTIAGESREAPLLSICIPTYNGARRLESALLSIAPQIAAHGSEVELLVSDNASADDTRDVVEKARRWCDVRYHRNEQNAGQARNVILLTHHLARGRFAWILGDDDVVREGSVARILRAIKDNPDVDYLFVNVTPRLAADRNAFARPVTGADFPELVPAKAKNLSDRPVANWNELVDPDVDDVFLGSLMVSVVRLSRFRTYTPNIGPGTETWASLEHSYVLPTVLAHTMPGRKAYYIGHPCVVPFQGEQEWLRHHATAVLVRLQELLDRYRQNGVESWRVERCRRHLLLLSESSFYEVMRDRAHPAWTYFGVSRFIWRNRRHVGLVRHLFANVARERARAALPLALYARLRTVKQRVWRILGRP